MWRKIAFEIFVARKARTGETPVPQSMPQAHVRRNKQAVRPYAAWLPFIASGPLVRAQVY